MLGCSITSTAANGPIADIAARPAVLRFCQSPALSEPLSVPATKTSGLSGTITPRRTDSALPGSANEMEPPKHAATTAALLGGVSAVPYPPDARDSADAPDVSEVPDAPEARSMRCLRSVPEADAEAAANVAGVTATASRCWSSGCGRRRYCASCERFTIDGYAPRWARSTKLRLAMNPNRKPRQVPLQSTSTTRSGIDTKKTKHKQAEGWDPKRGLGIHE